MKHSFLLVLIIVFKLWLPSHAQERTLGLISINESEVDEGFYLIAPLNGTNIYLINQCGELVNTWESNFTPGNTEYLSENGSLIAAKKLNTNPLMGAGGEGGLFEEFDWDGNLVWTYEISDSSYLGHHDFKILPNGNILLIAWEYKSYDEAIQAGRDSSRIQEAVWSETIFEIKPIYPDSAEIVWQWNLWDHLIQDFDDTKDNYGVVASNPQLVNINYMRDSHPDWIHANGLDYNEELDQIIISNHRFGEFYIIDHSTTTEEAATNSGGNSGKGGDILFRWGNPRTFNADSSYERTLYGQHNVNWVDKNNPSEGSILIFNNGNGRPDSSYSEVLMITPDISGFNYSFNEVFETLDTKIIYRDEVPTSFYAPIVSGAKELANGNFLITNGPKGEFFEMNSENDINWHYRVPTGLRGEVFEQGISLDSLGEGPVKFNFIFRADKYDPSFTGFNGIDMSANGFIELNPLETLCEDTTNVVSVLNYQNKNTISMFPSIVSNNKVYIQSKNQSINAEVILYNTNGDIVQEFYINNDNDINVLNIGTNVSKGLYIVSILLKDNEVTRTITKKLVLM